jgi:hypothetical protein
VARFIASSASVLVTEVPADDADDALSEEAMAALISRASPKEGDTKM